MISEERLNDAVAKILAVKLVQGHAREKSKLSSEQAKEQAHSTSEYEDSLTAVHESMVLIKN